jgi:hypothetical protein
MTTPIEITLANLGNGDLMECAGAELRKICDNIVIKPDPKGQMAAITYDVKTSMPGPDAGKTMAYIAFAPESKAISLFEVEHQPPLFEEERPLTPLATKQA